MSLFGDGSIWDSAASSMFFEASGVAKVLESGDVTVEKLLEQNEIIQDTQAHSAPLLDFLVKPESMRRLVTYLVVPQDEADEARAYRFPYMVCEVVSCAVPRLLDALTDVPPTSATGYGSHLHTLFSLLSPRLDTSLPAQRELRPYMLGYFCKVIALLCKKRPARLVTFLDRTPGIAEGIAAALTNGNVALMLNTLLDLPWHHTNAMGELRLARRDAATLPQLLLALMEQAADACGGAASTATKLAAHDRACAAQHAADVITVALTAARSSAPHSKFAVESYNAALLRGGAGGGADRERTSLLHSEDGHTNDLFSAAPPGEKKETLPVNPIINLNMQVDATFHEPQPRATDRLHVRLMKEFRDGRSAAQLCALVSRSVRILQNAFDQAGADASQMPAGTLQSAMEAPIRTLAAVVDTAAYSYRQQVVFAFGADSPGPVDAHARAEVPAPRVPLGPCPAVLNAIVAELPILLQYLTRVASSAHQAARAAVVSQATSSPLTTAAPIPSYDSAPKLGQAGLALVRLLAGMLRCRWPEVVRAAANVALLDGTTTSLSAALLDVMEAFAWHSICHRIVTDAFLDAIAFGDGNALELVVLRPGLHERIVAACAQNELPTVDVVAPAPAISSTSSPRSVRRIRVGYVGHYIALANAVLSRIMGGEPLSAVRAALDAHSGWQTLCYRELVAANVAHAVLIGGMAPDVKKSGNVGSSADATKPAAVDEVQAMDNKKDEEEDRESGSEEDEDEAEYERETRFESRPRALSGDDDGGDLDDGDAGNVARHDEWSRASSPESSHDSHSPLPSTAAGTTNVAHGADDFAAFATQTTDWAFADAPTTAARAEPGVHSADAQADFEAFATGHDAFSSDAPAERAAHASSTAVAEGGTESFDFPAPTAGGGDWVAGETVDFDRPVATGVPLALSSSPVAGTSAIAMAGSGAHLSAATAAVATSEGDDWGSPLAHTPAAGDSGTQVAVQHPTASLAEMAAWEAALNAPGVGATMPAGAPADDGALLDAANDYNHISEEESPAADTPTPAVTVSSEAPPVEAPAPSATVVSAAADVAPLLAPSGAAPQPRTSPVDSAEAEAALDFASPSEVPVRAKPVHEVVPLADEVESPRANVSSSGSARQADQDAAADAEEAHFFEQVDEVQEDDRAFDARPQSPARANAPQAPTEGEDDPFSTSASPMLARSVAAAGSDAAFASPPPAATDTTQTSASGGVWAEADFDERGASRPQGLGASDDPFAAPGGFDDFAFGADAAGHGSALASSMPEATADAQWDTGFATTATTFGDDTAFAADEWGTAVPATALQPTSPQQSSEFDFAM